MRNFRKAILKMLFELPALVTASPDPDTSLALRVTDPAAICSLLTVTDIK